MPQPETIRIDLPVAGLDLDQYGGVWGIDEASFSTQVAALRAIDLGAHVKANAGRDVSAVRSSSSGAVRLIDINGTLTKRGSSMSEAGAMSRLRQTVRAAANDPEIGAILLRIDSPGGTVNGTADLADEIAAARAKKPVYAFAEDLCASCAYWLAAQCDKVYANNGTANVGSIGVYMALYDYSRAAKNEGIEAVVIRSTPLKGAGIPGEAITDAQKAVWQELVDASHESFVSAVMRGRGMSREQAAAVATGRVYRASEAQKLGLIDGIKSFDETLAELSQVAAKRRTGRNPMSAASFSEIVAVCSGLSVAKAEDSQFVCDQLARGVEAGQAQAAWMQTLAARADVARQGEAAAKEEAAKLRGDLEKAKAEPAATAGGLGVEALEDTGTAATGTAASADGFWAAVADKQKAGLSRAKAVSAVTRDQPDLHKAMVAEANAGRKRAA